MSCLLNHKLGISRQKSIGVLRLLPDGDAINCKNLDPSVILDSYALNDLRVNTPIKLIDTRASQLFEQGHIPGAVNIPEIFSYLMTINEGGLSKLVCDFEVLLSNAGIQQDDLIVVYEDTLDSGYGQSCRGFFILDYLGHKQKMILEGGYKQWCDAGFPIETGLKATIKTNYQAQVNPDVLITLEQMKAALSTPQIIKLDCRDFPEWAGHAASPYTPDFDIPKGRIPGAVWIPWTALMDDSHNNPKFADTDVILSACADVGITPDSQVYVYCFKGSRSSNTMLALKKAGITNICNYLGSWNEWARQSDVPHDSRVL